MNMVFKRHKLALLLRLFGVWAALCLSQQVQAQAKLYRYVNEEGTKVIASSIPPKYVGKGYEILSPNGRVLQVIAPEPTHEDKARVESEKALLAEYEMLARRYSSPKDIEAARDRRLATLEANISVIKGNISNINSQIENQMSAAANFERAGKQVPARIFTTIDELRLELQNASTILKEREQEHEEIYQKFSDDIKTFVEGKALYEQKTTPQPERQG